MLHIVVYDNNNRRRGCIKQQHVVPRPRLRVDAYHNTHVVAYYYSYVVAHYYILCCCIRRHAMLLHTTTTGVVVVYNYNMGGREIRGLEAHLPIITRHFSAFFA